MIKIGLHGSTGKMGLEIASSLADHPIAELSYSYSRSQGDLSSLCANSDVVLDFSLADAVPALLDAASQTHTKLLIGTTALSTEVHAQIQQLAKNRAIIQTPNTSFGITLLKNLVSRAAKALSEEDVDIIDIHHSSKKDAPSGTALMLGKAASEARGLDFIKHDHLAGTRPKGVMGFSAIRTGGAPGEHVVSFSGANEVLVLSHRTMNRRVFAEGAVKAAIWLSSRGAGLYSMEDVLGL